MVFANAQHLIAVVAFYAGAALPAVAQHSPATDSARAAAIALLRSGAFIRVAISDEQFSASFVRRTGTDLVLAKYGREESIPTAMISKLWEADGRATRPAALRGAVILGALGAVFGFTFGGLWCGDGSDCGGVRVTGAVAGVTAGAAAGALVGAAVGTISPRWRQRYP